MSTQSTSSVPVYVRKQLPLIQSIAAELIPTSTLKTLLKQKQATELISVLIDTAQNAFVPPAQLQNLPKSLLATFRRFVKELKVLCNPKLHFRHKSNLLADNIPLVTALAKLASHL